MTQLQSTCALFLLTRDNAVNNKIWLIEIGKFVKLYSSTFSKPTSDIWYLDPDRKELRLEIMSGYKTTWWSQESRAVKNSLYSLVCNHNRTHACYHNTSSIYLDKCVLITESRNCPPFSSLIGHRQTTRVRSIKCNTTVNEVIDTEDSFCRKIISNS